MAKVKIVIIGAGIAGLSTYLFLEKHLKVVASSSTCEFEIKIYESYGISQPEPGFTTQVIGSAIGISKNGLSVVSRMEDVPASLPGTEHANDISMIDRMARRGHPVSSWTISTARGFNLAHVNLVPPSERETNDQQKQQQQQQQQQKQQIWSAARSPKYQSIMIARHAFWELLRDRVLAGTGDADTVHRRKVVDIVVGHETRLNVIKFEDGGEETADLVIGADGLRSILRKALFSKQSSQETDVANSGDGDIDAGEGAKLGKPSWLEKLSGWFNTGAFSGGGNQRTTSPVDYVTPHYEGLVGVGGFVPSSVLEAAGHRPGTMTVVFGPNGFFGLGYLTSNDAEGGNEKDDGKSRLAVSCPGPVSGWWSTFSSSDPYPYPPADSTSDSIKPTEFNRDLAISSLQARHGHWTHPVVGAVLSYISEKGKDSTTVSSSGTSTSEMRAVDAVYPTYTTPELPQWSAHGRAVLVGDAAHALQPSSGQGACQAMEDAEALGLLLAHHMGQTGVVKSSVSVHGALETALLQYENMRKPRVHEIYARSQRMSQMKADMGVVMEWIIYFLIYVMTWFRDDYNEKLFNYNLPAEVERVIRERQGG